MTGKATAFTAYSLVLASSVFLAGTVLSAPPGPPADPVLVYLNKAAAIEVSNADGGAKTVLRTSTRTVVPRRPTWDPRGSGTFDDPWHIVYEANYCFQLRRLAVWRNGSGGLATSDLPDKVIRASNPTDSDCALAADISPSGDRLVFGHVNDNGPSSIRTMENDDNGGGESQVIPAADGSQITWTSYSNDGSRIAYIESDSFAPYLARIKIVDIDGGVPIPVHDEGGRFIDWSPDGSKLAYSGNCGGSTIEGICLMDAVENSPPTRLTSGAMPTWMGDDKLVYAASTGISMMTISPISIKSLVRGAHHPKYRN